MFEFGAFPSLIKTATNKTQKEKKADENFLLEFPFVPGIDGRFVCDTNDPKPKVTVEVKQITVYHGSRRHEGRHARPRRRSWRRRRRTRHEAAPAVHPSRAVRPRPGRAMLPSSEECATGAGGGIPAGEESRPQKCYRS